MIRPALPAEIDLLCDQLGGMDPWKKLDIAGEALAKSIKDDQKRQMLVWEDEGTLLGVVVFRRYHFAESVFQRGFGPALAEHAKLTWPCDWREIPDGGYVHALAVFEGGHGKGVGSQLLRAAENQSFKSGIKRMYLMVSDFNKGAQGFYAMQGYRRIATLENCLKAGNTEHLMEKQLKDASETW